MNININNILKNELKILPIFKRLKSKPKKWQGMFNFKNIEHNLLVNNSFIINGCAINKRAQEYICYPLNYQKSNTEKIELIEGLNLEVINSLNNLKPVTFTNLEELIFYVYLDLIIIFLDSSETDFNKIIEERELVFNRFYRPSVLETNKYSVYLEKDGKEVICNKNIETSLIEIFLSLKIHSLELPMDYDNKKTIQVLKEFQNIMDYIKLPIKARKFHLKFKKLGIYKDDGFYSKETNAIIIDPRKTEVFIHELGHMIYDNNIKIKKIIKSLDSENYAKKFSLLYQY